MRRKCVCMFPSGARTGGVKRAWGVLVGLLVVFAGLASADVMPGKFRVEPVLRNLSHPQAVAFAPDGRIFYLERTTGAVRIIKFGKLLPTPFTTVPVHNGAEEGLLGIALHPKFLENRWVYLYYSAGSPATQRVVRFTAAGDIGVNQTVILDNIGEDTDGHDNGGALAFGADGKLYVSVGVFEADGQAMSWTSLQGKILRMNDDGSVPADNPHPENGYPAGLVYAIGFRDAPDIAVNSSVGTMYASDIYEGDAGCDETNVIRSAQNYGWNAVACSPGAYTEPLQSITPQNNVSGVASYTGSKYPGMTNNLFVAGASSAGKILRDVLTGASFDGLGSANSFFDPAGQTANCPTAWRHIDAGSDGWLYGVSDDATPSKQGIYRFIYDDGAKPREVAATPYIPLSIARDGSGLRLWWENLKKDVWNCSPPTQDQWWNGTPPEPAQQVHCPTGWTTSQKYTIWQGDLTQPFSYTNPLTKVAQTDGDGTQQNDALRSYLISTMPSGSKYFLVSARGANLEGSLGKSSAGVERPGGYTTTEQERCNAVGYSSSSIPPPQYSSMWNKCDPGWPQSYPDADNVMHTLSEWRGKVVLLSFMQFG